MHDHNDQHSGGDQHGAQAKVCTMCQHPHKADGVCNCGCGKK